MKILKRYWFKLDLPRKWRFFWQRRSRGFDDSELWSLDMTCAKLMAPRLQAFIDGYEQPNEWLVILNKMLLAFQIIIDCDCAYHNLSDEQNKAVEEGLDLFREYYFCLWE